MIDCHLHSLFSGDSEESPTNLVAAAAQKGLTYVAITDHSDIDYPDPSFNQPQDFTTYFEVLESVRAAYPNIYIGIGLEMGFGDNASATYKKMEKKFPFDYIINSVHVVDGQECYFADFFEGKAQKDAYESYFRQVLKSLEVDYYYSAIGHLGYVCRNAPFAKPQIEYADYGDYLDEILKGIIAKGKILEINSSTANSGAEILPSEDILFRYKELGGELINFGSDAHKAKNVAKGYDKAAAIAKAVGFEHFAVCKSRKIELVPI